MSLALLIFSLAVCISVENVLAGPAGKKLVFEDTFSTLNSNNWRHEISASGGGNWEFQIYSPEPANSYTRNNILYIKPTLTADKFGENFLLHGVIDVAGQWGSCTNDMDFGCHREGKYGMINPIMSAKLMSKHSWKYGHIEIEAKMPSGDWLWPAIWMLPTHSVYGTWPRSGEIDICETRGNNANYAAGGNNKMGATLHWGTLWNADKYMLTHGSKTANTGSYADGFHKYSVEWDANHITFKAGHVHIIARGNPGRPGQPARYEQLRTTEIHNLNKCVMSLTTFEPTTVGVSGIYLMVDDEVVMNAPTPSGGYWNKGQLTGTNFWAGHGQDAPFDQEFFIVLNVAAGGTNGYFPDNVGGKPWTNAAKNAPQEFWNQKHAWYQTWKGEDAAMQVKSVRVYQ